MRLLFRGHMGWNAVGAKPLIHFAFRARPYSILDEVKKNLENDEKLKQAREKLRMV
jgi:hypothetical protein